MAIDNEKGAKIQNKFHARVWTYFSTHIMKNKQPKISNYFETSQILL